jgi:nucleotide-binding universal stress UspA family protein
MGTHGRGGALKLLMGSVARGVARHAPCPVVLVGPGAMMRTARPSRILCAVDGSDASERAVRAAVDLARRLDDELVLLVVGDSSRTDIEALLPACSKVRSVAVEELRGAPASEILLRAQAKECELIVVGTDDRAALLGTVGSNLLRDAPCPVLTIPPKPA